MKNFLILLLLIFFSCEKSGSSGAEQSSVKEQSSTSVEQIVLDTLFKSGPDKIISSRSSINITFREAVVQGNFIGSTVSGSPFQFSPAIKGKTVWISTKELQFTPNKPLMPGVEYKGTLHGERLLGKQNCSDSIQISFTAAPQEIVDFSYDFSPIPGKKNRVVLKAKFEFAEVVDSLDVIGNVQLKGDGKIPLKLRYNKGRRFITLTSDELVRSELNKNFTLRLSSKYTADKSKWEQNITLPGARRFEVLYHSENSDPAQGISSYSFSFSDPIRSDMDLSGYVTVTPSIDYKVQIKGKQLILNGNFAGGIYYKVKIDKGFPSTYGTKTTSSRTYRMILENEKPRIEWLSDGVLLPTDNNSKLQFRTINIRKVAVKIHEVYGENLGFFLQNNGLLKQENDDYYYSNSGYSDLERVGVQVYSDTLKIDSLQNRWVNSEFNLEKLFTKNPGSAYIVQLSFDRSMLTGSPVSSRDEYEPGYLYYNDDNYYTNPAEYGYYYKNGSSEKLLIQSDVGLTLKESNDGYDIFAVNVLTARPESGMKVGIYSYQNRKISEGITNKDGMVTLKLDTSLTPSYVLGQGKSGSAILRLADGSWNLSTFDVGGASVKSDGTELFLYSDRGVHRPGDTIFLSGILRLNRKLPPASLPLSIEVKDAMGNSAFTEEVAAGENGHISWAIVTKSSDPTGTWNAIITVGDKKFHKPLPVEMVKPNRLKVTADIPKKVDGSEISGTVLTRYLFGTPAAGLDAEVFARIKESDFSPKSFSDFNFISPSREYDERWLTLFEGRLDDGGECSFTGYAESAERAPSMLRGEISLRVHEKGGSTVEKRFTTTISPFTAYAGVKDPFRWGSALIGDKSAVPVISVDPSGKAIAGRKLRVRLYINKKQWWWDFDQRNRRDFRSMDHTYLISETEMISGKSPVNYSLTVEDYGQHYLEITDLESGHETGLFFWGSRWASQARNGRGEETFLPIEINQNVYNPGDVATISCKSSDSAMAILTIEQDNKILVRKWAAANNGEIQFSVPVTEEMLPNCYAAVQLIQPHRSTGNDMPQALFGIKGIAVEEASTRLPLSVETPKEIRPEEQFDIGVTNDSQEDITVTVTVVDEGLLDLTDFKSPKPWNHFFRKLRLSVTSRDNFGRFLGALLPDMDRLFSIGGDAEEEAREDRVGDSEAKRFKPVVLFQKPVTISKGSKEKINFTMPNYVGEVRVMVAGAGENSFGSFEKQIPVKQPLMILPTLPRTVRPGDKFSIPVSIFAMDSTVSKTTVTVKSSGGIAVRTASQSVMFTEPGEEDITFFATVENSVGVDTVTITAKSGSEQTSVTIELPMQSANPYYTEVAETTVVKGKKLTLTPKPFGYEGTNKAKLILSRAPDIQIEKRAVSLIRYPYGCIEQTTSALIPQLVLHELMNLSPYRKEMITDNLNAGIARLREFKSGSSFSYWPRSQYYSSSYSKWGGLFAGHFLVMAKKSGYAVPNSQMTHWRNFALAQAKKVNSSDFRYQSYALFLLALDGRSNLGKMNLLKENYLSKLDPLSRELLATAYHLTGKEAVAQEISAKMGTIRDKRELSGTFGSPARDLAMFTYLASIRGDQGRATKMLAQLGKKFRPGSWSSTHETSLAILAFAEYYARFGKGGDAVEYEVVINGKKEKGTLHLLQKQFDISDALGKKLTISTKTDSPLFVSIATSGVPMTNSIKTESNGLQIQRDVYTESGKSITLNELKQGKPVWVVVRVKSSWNTRLEEIALSMVLPAGWEIVNRRLTGEQYPSWLYSVSEGTYCDIRDDRINWFFDVSSYSSKKFAVKITPSFSGTYTLPPVVAETMYSPDYYARIAGGTTVVKQR